MADDYKQEYLPRLQNSLIYKSFINKCSNKDNEAIALVDRLVSYAVQRTKTILKHMGEYTLHDSDHLFRVLHLMEKLLSEATIKQLSSPELMLLILSAFFHDIGMAPNENEVLTWRKVWDKSPVLAPDEEQLFDEFKRFYSARPDQQEIIERLTLQGNISTADTIKSYIISDYIRQTHAERARQIIDTDWKDKIVFRDTDLTIDFAQICFSHNEDALTLLELDKNLICGENTVACLPLIGITLRLADILDFDAKRTPSILYSHLSVRHPVSLKEWKKHRSVEAWEISPDLIQFSAKCKHPAIEASIHEFCNLIDRELSVCNNISSNLNDFNKEIGRNVIIKLPFKVNREKIRTERDIYNKPKYIYRETKFNLSKRQVIELLMGTKLYGNPEVALRELLQNSIDACLLRQALEKKWGNLYLPEISVRYFTENQDTVLEIEDNGTGMDQYIIDNYYSKVGSSFYKSTDFYNLASETNLNFAPTSRFGIGILSCFMVADTLIVDTKRVYAPHKSSDPLNVTVEGQESIFWIKEGNRQMPGTKTKLILRKSQNPWERMDEEQFITSVENVIPNPPFTINIETSSHKKSRDETSFKRVTAESIKDSSWNENDNVRTFDIELDFTGLGIVGSAKAAILESHGVPVERIHLNSREVEIEGNSYTLDKEMQLSENLIEESSMSISIDDDGEISDSNSVREYARSKSRISLHGIEIPSSLFPRSWEKKKNQVGISWPFPLIIVVDVCGMRDLDLNSSRSQILLSPKWLDFEEELSYLICSQIAGAVSKKYWTALKTLLTKRTKNEVFLKGLKKVKK